MVVARGLGMVPRYGGRVDHVRWTARPTFGSPVIIAAFEGWNDAGEAASTAARYLLERWDAEPVASIDPEEFFDFTSTRPHVQLDDEGHRQIVWPSTELYVVPDEGAGVSVAVLLGPEPELRWRTYCRQVTDVATAVGARLVVTLGALLAEVPHSRPVPVTGTAPDPDSVAGLSLRASTYEGPTGIVGVLHTACRDVGIASASLWATVPSYVPAAASPKATLALVERTAALLGRWVPTTELEIATAAYERQVDELVQADEETANYVASLERRHDDESDPFPSGASLVEEVERFLRDGPE